MAMDEFVLDSQAQTMPVVSGHRGASGLAPENTMAAVRKAMQLGATMTEIDVHLTKDGHVVLMHDDSLHRTTNGRGLVAEKTVDEIKKMDAGSWFDKAYAGEPVPTLDEVMDLVRGKMKLNIEIKISGLEPDIAERTIAVIHENEFSDQCVITSFDRATIEKVKVLAPDIRTGWIFSKIPGPEIFGGTWEVLSVNYKSVTPEFMEKARAANKQVYVWTVNKPAIMKRMIQLGVDAILTDYPDRLIEVLDQL
jgi:glycerophosphoryl diester phosphodiesterase